MAKQLGISEKRLKRTLSIERNLTLAANFQRSKNSDAKQRKVATEYVRLCGYKHGEIGRNHFQHSQNGKAGMTLEEIALQLGTSKTNLTRALSIGRNLTDSMKELLDWSILFGLRIVSGLLGSLFYVI